MRIVIPIEDEEHRMSVFLIEMTLSLPPLLNWPDRWLDQARSPQETLKEWLSHLDQTGLLVPAHIEDFSDELAWAVIMEITHRCAQRALTPEDDQELLRHLTHELSLFISIHQDKWERDERSLKQWLRDEAKRFVHSRTQSEPGTELEPKISAELPADLESDLRTGSQQSSASRPALLPEMTTRLTPGPSAPRARSESDSAPLAPPPALPSSSAAIPTPPRGLVTDAPAPQGGAPDLSGLDVERAPDFGVQAEWEEALIEDEDVNRSGEDLDYGLSQLAQPAPESLGELSRGDIQGGPLPPAPSAPPSVQEVSQSEPVREEGIFSQDVARRFIDQEITRPGPLERALERVKLLSNLLYRVLGFSTLIILHLIDNLWDFISSYISKVFKGLMYTRSAARVAARRADGQLVQGVQRDIEKLRWIMGRALCLPTHCDTSPGSQGQAGSVKGDHSPEELWLKALTGGITLHRRDTPLSWTLSARARLDDLRRDLGFMQSSAGSQKRILRVIFKWLIGLIPNPLELFRPWLNALLLSLKVNYNRAQVEERYQTLNELLSQLIDEMTEMERDLSRAPSASEKIVRRLQAELDHFMALSLQSSYHARPWRWRLVDRLWVISAPKNDPHRIIHPLSVIASRQALLEVCADLERQPELGVLLKPREKSYQLELQESRALLKRLRALRERGRV